MKKIKEIYLSDFDNTNRGMFGKAQPYAVYFVYKKDQEPVVVKGMADDVFSYVNKHFPVSVFYYTYWQDGKCRYGAWRGSLGLYLYFDKREIRKGKYRYIVFMMIKDNGWAEVASFRRIPRKWIPLYDKAIKREKEVPKNSQWVGKLKISLGE